MIFQATTRRYLEIFILLERVELQFLTDGFSIIDLPEIHKFIQPALSAFERLINNAEQLGIIGHAKVRKSNNIEPEGKGWSWGCDHIYSPLLREQILLDLASLNPLPEILQRILGDRIRFSGGHGHWSPINYDYYLHWHRDTRRERWHLANLDPRSHVQVCIALKDEEVIRIVPGSHLRDLDSWEYKFITTFPHGDHPQQVVVKVPAGSVLLLNTYTFHRAQCQKETHRRCLHYGFSRIGAKPEPGRQDKFFHWLSDPNFLSKQTNFLKTCINEQILEQMIVVKGNK